MAEVADKIFHGGGIITIDANNNTAEALAVRGKAIIAIGKYADVIKTRGDVTEMVDLAGKTLMPGFVEPHSHPFTGALLLNHFVDIRGLKYPSKVPAIELLQKIAKETPEGEWIMAYGYDPVLMTDLLHSPTTESIDRIVSDKHPILVVHQSGHSGFANTLAFSRAGVTKDTPDPIGGAFVRDENGVPTGSIIELPALRKILAAGPKLTKEIVDKYCKTQFFDYADVGITALAELGVGVIGISSEPLAHFVEVAEACECPVRLVGYVPDHIMKGMENFKPEPASADKCAYFGGVKCFADGSPFVGTMAVHEPYLDSHMNQNQLSHPKYPNYGYLNKTFEEVITTMRPFHEKGFQIAVHAQGERGIEQTLDVFEALLKETPRTDHRYRLEHAGLITKDQIHRAHTLGVTISFLHDHLYFYGQGLSEGIIGKERTNRWCPLGTATEVGIRWTLHADSPVLPPNPLRSIQVATTRRGRQVGEATPDVFGPGETVPIDVAVRGVTINAAWQCGLEHLVGSLEVGKLADLVVLEKNPYEVPLDEISEIQVLGTYKNGEKVARRS